MAPYILTIDAGTTSIKVSLFDTGLKQAACNVQEYRLTADGTHIEAGAHVYTDALIRGIQAVHAALPGCEIAAIGITTQGETLALFDESGMPLTPFLVWLDSRAGRQAEKLAEQLPPQTFYEETGLPELSGALPLAKVMWLKDNQPELFEKACKVLLLEDYLLYWLSGSWVTEKSLQTSTGWFSLKQDGYWKEALDAAGLSCEMLPTLTECGTQAGTLTQTASQQLGIPEGIPVVCGAMDQTAAALAAGCTRDGVVTETTGTALVMAACTEHPVFTQGHHVTVYRHALAGKYLYLPIGNTAGMALKWFRDEFCADLPKGEYGALDAFAKSVPAGCGGLIFLPFLEGSVDPDSCPEAKAVFFGATLASTRAHFTRAIFESIGFLLRDFLGMLSALGVAPAQVLSLGGGSRSAVWQQIKADICGLPFVSTDCSEAASKGAALLAMQGAGLPRQEEPEHKETRYEPNKKDEAAYTGAYQAYRCLYRAVEPLYRGEGR